MNAREERKRLLSANIAALLKDLNLPLTELASRLGVSEDKASFYISGKYNFTLNDIVRIESMLDFEIVDIMQPISSMQPESVVSNGYKIFISDIEKAAKKFEYNFKNAPKVDMWQGSKNNDIIARFEGVRMMLQGLKKK